MQLCSIALILSKDERGIAEIHYQNVSYGLKSFTDVISRQILTCGSVALSHDAFKEILVLKTFCCHCLKE